MLSSSSPVSASTMSGGRAIPARSRTWISVASPCCTWCSNSSSSRSKRSRRCSTRVASWPCARRVRRMFEPTFPPPVISTYTGPLLCLYRRPTRLAGAHDRGELVDGRLRGTDGAHALARIERGAGRVEDAYDHAAHVEALLRDLRHHEIRVVAVRGHDHRVGVLDARLAQAVEVHPVAEEERAAPPVAQAGQRLFLLVDDGHVPEIG